MRQRHATASLFHTDRHAGYGRRHSLLNRFGDTFNFSRRLARLFRQSTYFISDNGKSAPMLTRMRCLNRGINRQQVGLRGDFTDCLHHSAYLL
ncbi:hypothetical protein D3C78_1327800 [compost metagenome]